MSEASRIRRWAAQEISRNISQQTRAVALHVLTGVVMRTPVDTGRARGNWNTAIGGPSGRVDMNARDPAGAGSVARGAAVIATHREFQQIVLDNNLPYIGRLNDGWSKQAPRMYVEQVIAGLGLGTGRG